MHTDGERVGPRAVGGDRPRRHVPVRAAALVAGSLVAGVVGFLALPTAATADSAPPTPLTTDAPEPGTPSQSPTGYPQDQWTPVPPPSGTPTPTRPPSGAPTPPTIADPGDITTTLGRFSGTATPGHRVRVADPAVPSASVCQAVAAPGGTWSCVGTVHSAPQQVFTVLDVTAPGLAPADAPASDVIVPPSITTSGPTTGTVTGTGRSGATVTVGVAGSTATRTAAVGRDGHWSVSWSTGGDLRPDGAATMTATQTASTGDGYRSDLRSAASAPVTVTIDRTPPAPPRITAPATGDRVRTQPVTVSGSAETGSRITVYVGSTAVCQATAAGGTWSCSTAGTTLAPGTRSITAVAGDVAGNFSQASSPVRVVVPTGAPTTDRPDASGSTPSTARPGSAASGASGPAAPGTPDGDATAGAGGAGTGPGGPGPGARDWSGPAGDWSVATAYDRALPTIGTTLSWRTAATVAAAVVGFLLLVAGPVRLLARTARRHGLRVRTRFTGRNRPAAQGADSGMPTWAAVGLGITVTAVLTLLGTGVAVEARYVRLAIGVLLGTGTLVAGFVLATRWAAGQDRRAVTFRVSPWLVLAAAVACALTRSADLSPAVVVGVVLVPVGRTDLDTGAVRLGRDVAACARGAFWRSTALTVLAATGWVLHGTVPGSGFWGSLVSEFALTLCVGGLGSLVVTLLPVARSAGGALWATSRARYAAVASVAVALAAAVYSGPDGTHLSPVVMVSAAVACAAAAALVWFWVRLAGTGTGTGAGAGAGTGDARSR